MTPGPVPASPILAGEVVELCTRVVHLVQSNPGLVLVLLLPVWVFSLFVLAGSRLAVARRHAETSTYVDRGSFL